VSLVAQEKTIASLLKIYGFHLLISPSSSIDVGKVLEGTPDGIDLSPVDDLSAFVKPKNTIPTPIYQYPQIARDSKIFDYKGIIKQFSSTSLAVDFFKGLFDKIAAKLGIKLSVKYSARKIQAALYSFVDNTADTIAPNAVSRSLTNFIVDRKYWKTDKKYFVVLEVYRSRQEGMVFADGDQKDIDATLGAKKLASFEFEYSRGKDGLMMIFSSAKKNKAIPFGIKVGELTYDPTEESLRVNWYRAGTSNIHSPVSGRDFASDAYAPSPPSKRRAISIRSKRLGLKGHVGPPENIFVRIKDIPRARRSQKHVKKRSTKKTRVRPTTS
jgi:hypothetical protein